MHSLSLTTHLKSGGALLFSDKWWAYSPAFKLSISIAVVKTDPYNPVCAYATRDKAITFSIICLSVVGTKITGNQDLHI